MDSSNLNHHHEKNEIEIWAGLESTINRVGDIWYNQCDRNGHCSRIEDLDLFAGLKIKKLRYPVLWETSQQKDGSFNFDWVEPRLNKIWNHGIEPIATLLQHGSGPNDTSLVDSDFPEKLARYAHAVAKKFPKLRMYTPVNEPLTTARFSGLYGVWYPHGRSNKIMLRALLNECKGTILAMQEIRKINPDAKLVQTEDMGRASGTEPCQRMVDFQNKRRWLSFDLLCGKVDHNHPLRKWMIQNGVSSTELNWFLQKPCPPDVIGINHYLLSNRFIDHRAEMYPHYFRNSQGFFKFADLGTTQVNECFPDQNWAPFIPAEEILREVCERYDLPVVVTEVHIAGPREAQMQWLYELWNSANRLKQQGYKIEAITPWSLLGSFDWNTLCSKGGTFYEPGVFDIRAQVPRPTALAQMIQDLATRGQTHHAVLDNPGYWYRKPSQGAPILITGANETLNHAFCRVAERRGLPYVYVSPAQIEFNNIESIRNIFNGIHPWAVINTMGFIRVDEAEQAPDQAYLKTVVLNELLASECDRLKVPYLTFSSDLVFDGNKESKDPFVREPYLESDVPTPICVYGHTKAEMEKKVLGRNSNSLIVRTSTLFSPWDSSNFAVRVLRSLQDKKTIDVTTDVVMAPTYVPTLVDVCLDLLIDGVTGLTHLANRGEISWAEFAREIASLFQLDHQLIRPLHLHDLNFIARRPRYTVISSERFQIMPSFQEELEKFKSGLPENLSPIVSA